MRAQSPARRELFIFALALACGLLLLPWFIWIAGDAVLGPYAHGGATRFFGDFFLGLGRGSPVFWIVALGPALFLLVVRLFWHGLKSSPPQ